MYNYKAFYNEVTKRSQLKKNKLGYLNSSLGGYDDSTIDFCDAFDTALKENGLNFKNLTCDDMRLDFEQIELVLFVAKFKFSLNIAENEADILDITNKISTILDDHFQIQNKNIDIFYNCVSDEIVIKMQKVIDFSVYNRD